MNLLNAPARPVFDTFEGEPTMDLPHVRLHGADAVRGLVEQGDDEAPSVGRAMFPETVDLPDEDDEPPHVVEDPEDAAIREARAWMWQKIACGPIKRHELFAAGEEKGHLRQHLGAAYYKLHLVSDRVGEGYLVRVPADLVVAR